MISKYKLFSFSGIFVLFDCLFCFAYVVVVAAAVVVVVLVVVIVVAVVVVDLLILFSFSCCCSFTHSGVSRNQCRNTYKKMPLLSVR